MKSSHSVPIERGPTPTQAETPTGRRTPLHDDSRARRFRDRPSLHLLLLIGTFYTLTLGGAMTEAARLGLGADAFAAPLLVNVDFLRLGIPYSLGLLGILGIHELGHYVACRRYGVDASLPFFLPSVPMPFGTFGAFIRIRSRIPSRRALFDIGLAGPLAGFAVVLPVLIYGLAIAEPVPRTNTLVLADVPLIYSWFRQYLPREITADQTIWISGPLKAAWVGCLATALNLFPIGQLDGGHVCYAISPRFHRIISVVSLIGFTALGLLVFPGWLFMATLLILFNPKHPPVADEAEPLSSGRLVLAVVGGIVLIVCFIARPV